MTHDEPCSMAPDDKHDLISGTCSHLPYGRRFYIAEKLSPLGQSFIESLFFKRKAWAWWKSRVGSETEQDSPFLDLYRVAEQVVLEAFPNKRCWPVLIQGWKAEMLIH
ncbi:hypothetical protein AWN70_00300 [Escherichia coli]|nr:hypothetical protein AWN70_00300 [Escherichia coli]